MEPRHIMRRFGLLVLPGVPTVTELLESGRLPRTPRELITDVVLTVILALLVLHLRRVQQHLERLGVIDPLSGVFNRRKLFEDLPHEIGRARRQGGSLVLAFLDIDRFKRVNDRFGHDAGDGVIQGVARALTASIREHVDRCYRVGGDEFVILMPASGTGGTAGLLERIEALADTPQEFLARYGASLSLGVAELEPADTPETLLRRADRGMYSSKLRHHRDRTRRARRARSR